MLFRNVGTDVERRILCGFVIYGFTGRFGCAGLDELNFRGQDYCHVVKIGLESEISL